MSSLMYWKYSNNPSQSNFLLNPSKINRKFFGFIDYERIEIDPIIKGGKMQLSLIIT